MAEHTQTHEFDSAEELMMAVNRLEKAEEKPVSWVNPETERREFLEGYKALHAESDGTVFNVVSDEYQIINPPQFFGPFVSEITERDQTDISGDVLELDNGARGFATVLFDSENVYLPGRDDPLKCGFNFRWSHDNGLSVNVRGFAQDTACSNSMRQITDSINVKHAGDVDDRIDWEAEWSTLLDQFGAFKESLAQMVEQAMNYRLFDLEDPDLIDQDWIEMTNPHGRLEQVELPTGFTERDRTAINAFYDYIDLPRYLALEATDRLLTRLARKDSGKVVTAWDAYSAGTWALTHHSRSTRGTSSEDRHHRNVADIMLNPHGVLETARRELQSRIREARGEEQEAFATSVREAVPEYRDRAEALEGSLEA